jgi:hypothetical protein
VGKQDSDQEPPRRLGSGEGIARSKGNRSGDGVPLWMWVLSASGFVALAIVIVVIALTRGGGSTKTGSGVIDARNSTAKIDPALGTWPPVYTDLRAALTTLGLPGLSDTVEHYHAHIHLIVDGRDVPIPEDIGLDQSSQTYSPVHTHAVDGVIHIEADQKGYRSDLQNVFDVWGVRFNPQCVGGYCDGVKMWVNGKPSAKLGAYILQPHDAITIVEGTPPAGFTPDASYNWPPNE